jgi:hypothetical protein
MEEVKKILTDQLKFVSEESKKDSAFDLSRLTEAMCVLAKTIKEL